MSFGPVRRAPPPLDRGAPPGHRAAAAGEAPRAPATRGGPLRSALATAWLPALLLGGCLEPTAPPLPPVACWVLGEAGGADTLRVTVSLDSLGEDHGGRVLVRVDRIADGFVRFRDPRPDVAAAALAVTPGGRFVGCAGPSRDGLRFSLPARHARKAWMRVSSEHPVRVGVEGPPGQGTLGEPLTIRPGASGVVTWGPAPVSR